MVPTLTRRPARRSLVLALLGALTLALAGVGVGALASQDGGRTATVFRPAGAVEDTAPIGPYTVPIRSGPAVALPSDPTPRRVYADWQINEMNARHPEP